jgi:hypothetical protein
MRALVVKSPFGDYQKGSRITDQKAIDDILAGPQKVHVITSEHEDEPVVAPLKTAALEKPEVKPEPAP